MHNVARLYLLLLSPYMWCWVLDFMNELRTGRLHVFLFISKKLLFHSSGYSQIPQDFLLRIVLIHPSYNNKMFAVYSWVDLVLRQSRESRFPTNRLTETGKRALRKSKICHGTCLHIFQMCKLVWVVTAETKRKLREKREKSVYCWWRLCDTVESYKTKIWEVETRIYFVKFVYQGQEWAFIETELKKKLLRGELKIKRSQ